MTRTEYTAHIQVDPVTGCHLWTRSLDTKGYAHAVVDGRDIRVHRMAYEQDVGPIPEGLELDHLCRVRKCVNPAHLEPVTRRENMIRGEGPCADNARKTHCPEGHPLTADNLYLHKGSRYCRTCRQRQQLEYKARQRSIKK